MEPGQSIGKCGTDSGTATPTPAWPPTDTAHGRNSRPRLSNHLRCVALVCGLLLVLLGGIGDGKAWGQTDFPKYYPVATIPAERFHRPSGISMDPAGNLYVADTGNHRVVKLDADGNFVKAWGHPGSTKKPLGSPTGIVLDSDGTLLVADRDNHRLVRYSLDGKVLAVIGSQGFLDGQLLHPLGIALDGARNIYVTDSGNSRIQKFASTGGHRLCSILCGNVT